jgi:hypothetical protein
VTSPPLHRHVIARRACTEGPEVMAELVAPEFAPEGTNVLGLGILRRTFLPELTVEIDEVFDAPEDRVVVRLTVRTGGPDSKAWDAVQIFRFREDDQIVGVWSLQDSLPLLQALDVVPDDATLAKDLEEIAAARLSGY